MCRLPCDDVHATIDDVPIGRAMCQLSCDDVHATIDVYVDATIDDVNMTIGDGVAMVIT